MCLLAPATTQAEVKEVTSTYVKNANFSAAGDWDIKTGEISGTARNNNCQEFYNDYNASSWFRMSQTITGLPKGVYRYTVNGFTRDATSNITNTVIFATTNAREYITPIWARHMCTEYNGGTQPNSMSDASAAFYSTTGDYWLNTIDLIVVTDGQLTIGARNAGQLRPGQDKVNTWTILGNVKLYELTGADIKPLLNKAIGLAQDLASEGTGTGLADLNSAIASAQAVADANLTVDHITALQTAMANYRKARMADATTSQGVDATHLISNAGFEDGTDWTLGTANGSYNQPKGWTLQYGATHTNNNAGIACTSIIQAGVNTTISPTEGGLAYAARLRWTSSSHIALVQELQLPAGTYSLSADLGKLVDGITAPLLTLTSNLDGQELVRMAGTAKALTTYTSPQFTLHKAQKVTLSISTTQNLQSNTLMAADNLRLTYYGTANVTTEGTYAATALELSSAVSQLNEQLELFASNYNNKVTHAKAWQLLTKAVTAAEQVKDNADATEADIVQATDNLTDAMRWTDAYLLVEEAIMGNTSANVSALITNTNASDNLNGWTSQNMQVLSSQSFKGITDNYFDANVWGTTSTTASMQQVLRLPAGYYQLGCTARASANMNCQITLGDVLQFVLPSKDDTGGNVWAYAASGSGEAGAHGNVGYGWNTVLRGFYLANDTKLTLKVEGTHSVNHQWFSIDDFTLTYALATTLPSQADGHIKATGTVLATALTELANAETRSIDLTGAAMIVGTPAWPTTLNPNCVIYAPVGLLDDTHNVVCNGICTDLTLADRKPFNAPTAFTARQATYSRQAYTDGLYETLYLPYQANLPEHYSIEEVTADNGQWLTLETTTDATLQAGKAYLMRYTGEAAEGTQTLTLTAQDAEIAAYSSPVASGLFGSTEVYKVSTEGTVYLLSASDAQFKPATAGSWSAPFRACYAGGSSAMANLQLFFDDPTAIPQATVLPAHEPVDVYDLQGRRLLRQVTPATASQQLRPGLYLFNHKKVIVKP